jgi:hypothetical protein
MLFDIILAFDMVYRTPILIVLQFQDCIIPLCNSLYFWAKVDGEKRVGQVLETVGEHSLDLLQTLPGVLVILRLVHQYPPRKMLHHVDEHPYEGFELNG